MSRKLTASQLLATTDAAVWAEQVWLRAKDLGLEDIDEGWMIGWFANAMAAQEMAMRSQTLPADFRFPESPQDTDSTETVEGNQKMSAEQLEEFEREVNEASLAYEAAQNETVQPMADLSGIDHSPAFEGYQPNGSLPEAD